jgi:hypothetical protein
MDIRLWRTEYFSPYIRSTHRKGACPSGTGNDDTPNALVQRLS